MPLRTHRKEASISNKVNISFSSSRMDLPKDVLRLLDLINVDYLLSCEVTEALKESQMSSQNNDPTEVKYGSRIKRIISHTGGMSLRVGVVLTGDGTLIDANAYHKNTYCFSEYDPREGYKRTGD